MLRICAEIQTLSAARLQRPRTCSQPMRRMRTRKRTRTSCLWPSCLLVVRCIHTIPLLCYSCQIQLSCQGQRRPPLLIHPWLHPLHEPPVHCPGTLFNDWPQTRRAWWTAPPLLHSLPPLSLLPRGHCAQNPARDLLIKARLPMRPLLCPPWLFFRHHSARGALGQTLGSCVTVIDRAGASSIPPFSI
jgi:hypothetical protein